MKKFTDFPVVKEYDSKDKKAVLKYIELLYSKGSLLIKIENLDERKKVASEKAGLNAGDHQDLILLKKDSKEANLVFVYLSHYQNNNKFHSLIASQQLLWRMHRIMMEDNDSNMEQALKWSKESEGLSSRIDNLMSEIYGTSDVMEIASTEIRKVISLPRHEEMVRKAVGDAE